MPKSNNMGKAPEKAKNFKFAMVRLIKELKSFKTLIILSLVLAMLSSVISIFTPNKLSDLTDSISSGLTVNEKNLEVLQTNLEKALSSENILKVTNEVLTLNISEKNITAILSDSSLTKEEKTNFQNFLTSKDFSILTTNVLKKIVIPNDGYTQDEVISFICSNNSIANISDKILLLFFEDITIDKTVISKEDQVKALKLFTSEEENIASSLNQMPESIQTILSSKMDLTSVKNISLLLLILYLVSAIFSYIESISMTHVSNKFAQNLRKRIAVKINKLPLKFFDKHLSGDILSRVTNDVDTVAQMMNQSLATLVSSVTLFVGTVIMMFVTNYILAITAIVASLLGFSFMIVILNKSQKYFIQKQTDLGNLNGHIEEVYSGLNIIKTYNATSSVSDKFDELNNKMFDANRKSSFLSGLMMPMMNFVGNFGYVAVCIVGALLAFNGHITFGVIIAFITYVRLFTSPLSQIAQAMTSLQSTAAASERVFEFLDEEQMRDEKDLKTKLVKGKVKGNIEFKDVVFKYDGNDKPTIKGFSAKVSAGQKIAIVGPTGAGKTTMVNLLMKFYEIDSGDILIDGISIHDLTRENIHDLFTMVLQDTWLFNGTVKENIVYNRENVSLEKVKEVCQTVGLDHFIKTLPNTYDSYLSDNDSVSSGQKQLMTIARGMIENDPFLILDEATSNVDTRTEELVQKSMDKLTEGKTSFIIAHRLSTIKNADLILVMKDGNIIEQGNHEKLMAENDFYADLYNSQFKL